jgi:hypothetical protein
VSGIADPDRATRLARAIASDIGLYNETKVKEAIANDAFFDALAPELEEGRALFEARVTRELYDAGALYWRAIVDVIIAAQGGVRSPMW